MAGGVWLYFASLLVLASAAKLAFNTPNLRNASGDALTSFTIGDSVTISWWTLFPNTTLAVFQQLKNGTVLYEVLAYDWPRSKTEVSWTAGSIHQHPLRGSKFHFVLSNGLNTTCDTCTLSSKTFVVNTASQASNTSHHTTSTSTSTTAQTHSATSTHTPGAIVDNSVRPGMAGNRSLQLGVGLGAGIPAALGLVVILCLWGRHRSDQRRGRQKLDEDTMSQDSSPLAEITAAQMRERDSHLSRESGALGIYASNPSPTWEQQESRLQAESQPYYRHRRGSSRMPFRPSLGAHSEASDEDSRHSWIDNFDFEQPEYQHMDELSQIHQSIREAPSPAASYYNLPLRSDSRHVDLANLPEVPQPVHQWYPNQNWPPRR